MGGGKLKVERFTAERQGGMMKTSQDNRPFEIKQAIFGFEMIHNTLDKYISQFANHWHVAGFTDKPKGKEQESECEYFETEWVDQGSAYPCDDCFEGHIYLPLPDGRYLQVYFVA